MTWVLMKSLSPILAQTLHSPPPHPYSVLAHTLTLEFSTSLFLSGSLGSHFHKKPNKDLVRK